MSGLPLAPLSTVVADARPGFASGDDLEHGLFQVRMNNISVDGSLDLRKRRRVSPSLKASGSLLVQPGDILFNATNSPELVGKSALVRYIDEPTTFSNHFIRLRPSSAVDGGYLARWLHKEFVAGRFKGLCRQWVNQATVSRESLLALELPLPALTEQRRIAAILDQADALRAKRREALTQLDRLTQAIFVEMFGDPVVNSKRWPRATLGDVLDEIESGTSPNCLDRPAGPGEWGVLKLGAVTQCTYRPDENKALPKDTRPDPLLEVRPGDLLFSRKNTYELVGASAYVKDTPPKLLLPDLIFRFRLRNGAPLDPRYMHQLLTHPSKRREIQKLASGSAGSMPNISKARLTGAQIELPPLDLQKQFAVRLEALDAQQRAHSQNARELQILFSSLQHRAFRGEL